MVVYFSFVVIRPFQSFLSENLWEDANSDHCVMPTKRSREFEGSFAPKKQTGLKLRELFCDGCILTKLEFFETTMK